MAKPKAIRPVTAGTKIKSIIYGDPGVGKTRLLGSSPKPTLIIRPPMDHTDSLVAVGSSADEWVVDNWNEMEEVYEYCRHDGYKEYDWWGLDSISIFQDAGLDDVFEDTVARKGEDRRAFGPDKGEYGVNMHRLAKWVRHMLAVDMNAMITAHPFRTEDNDGEVMYMPWIQGKQMPEKICGYMNLVGYLTVRERDGKNVRALVTDRKGKWYAKDGFGVFDGQLIVNPTIPKLEEIIEKAKKEQPERKKPRKKAAAKKATSKKATTKKAAADKADVEWDDV